VSMASSVMTETATEVSRPRSFMSATKSVMNGTGGATHGTTGSKGVPAMALCASPLASTPSVATWEVEESEGRST
jgi:hypothetical protein